jgi:sulfur-carrier protein adenylyltransferase/sulfurtransferase
MAELLHETQKARYARQITLPDFGEAAQAKLQAARVLVIGAGGLSCPMLLYLAAAGVGHLTIIDPDCVEENNLQRQILYTTADIGTPKATAAKMRLEALNPYLNITAIVDKIHAENALALIAAHDVVADGSDNFPTRYLVNDACVLSQKPLVYGAVFRYEGQVSVFNHLQTTGERSPNYRDVFATPPPPELVVGCAEGGVLGVLTGIIGTMQANEVLKVLTQTGETLAGKLLLFDAATCQSRTLRLRHDPNRANIETLIDYDFFCGITPHLPTINVPTLKEWQSEQRDFQLIDVRQAHEHARRNLGGLLLPLAHLDTSHEQLRHDVPTVVYCQSGARSAAAQKKLLALGFTEVFSLEGGIEAYLAEEE